MTMGEKIEKQAKKLEALKKEIDELSAASAGDMSLLGMFCADVKSVEKKLKRLKKKAEGGYDGAVKSVKSGD